MAGLEFKLSSLASPGSQEIPVCWTFSGDEFRITEGEGTHEKQYKVSEEIKACRGS